MLLFKNLVSLATWTSLASASYFYKPDWMCELDKDCTLGKREVDSRSDGPGLSMRIVRVPQANTVRDARADANKMARRYQDRSATIEQRTNSYKVVSAATPTATNSAGVDQDGTDYSYFIKVGLGSANQGLNMLLDTGAGTTWVMGPSCTTDACNKHTTFDTSQSKTFQDLGTPFAISYGSGSVNGTLAQDTLSMAGLKITTTIGIAKTTSNDFNNFPIDGILGLSLAKGTTPHFWESVAASKALKANIIGLDINRSSDGPNNGEITFGAVDSTRFTGDIKYYPVADNAEGDWAVTLGDVAAGSSKAGISGRVAYIDSGTSFVFGPPEDMKAVHALIPGASSADGATYTVPCDTAVNINLIFGSDTYSISPKDWVSPKVNGVCTSNLYGLVVVDKTSWLVGDVFLKNVYAVFDYDQTRIGFAANAPVSAAASSSSISTSSLGSTSPTSSSGQSAPSSTTSSSSSSKPISTSLVTGSTTGPTTGYSTGSSITSGTQSNQGSSSIVASPTGSTTSAPSAGASHVTPGLNGHETGTTTTGSSASIASAAAASGSTESSTPKKSSANTISCGTLALTAAIALFFV